MSESGGKRISSVTLINAEFLKQHFPNAPSDARTEWLTSIKHQALYSIADLEFISEQTWKDMALPGLVRDKLQALSGWGQSRNVQRPANVSPQRSRPPSSNKDRSDGHHSPQRSHKHSDDHDRNKPSRLESSDKHGRSEGSDKHGRLESSDKRRSKESRDKPHTSHSSSHKPSSSSSSSDAKSRSSHATSPNTARNPHKSSKSLDETKKSSDSTHTAIVAPLSSSPVSSSSQKLTSSTTSLTSKHDEDDWSDSSSSEKEEPKPAAPEITLQTIVSPPATPPVLSHSSGTAGSAPALLTASASAPVPPARTADSKARPALIGKDRPASPVGPSPAIASPPAPPALRPPSGWFAARESTDSGGSALRNSSAGGTAALRNSGPGVPAIIGRRAENNSAPLVEPPKKAGGSAIGRSQIEPKQPTATKEEKQKRLGHIRQELFSTEKVYVQDLASMRDVYYVPLQQQKLLSDLLLNTIFTNTQSLLGLSKVLLDDITKAMETGQGMGPCFLRMSEFMKMYSQYCSNYDTAVAALTAELRTNPRLAGTVSISPCIDAITEFLKRQSLIKGVPVLESLLIKPIQRLCKYPLLLREMLKQMDATEPDYATLEHACTALDAVVSKVNDSKRQFEIMQRVARYKRRLVNAHYIDLNAPGRQYIRDGPLRMIGASKQKDVTVLLFSDMLIVCRPAKAVDGQPDPELLKLKVSPPLHLAFVTEIPDGTIPEVNGAFSVSWEAMDGRNEKLTLYTWPDDRVLWVDDLARCIDARRAAKMAEKRASVITKPMQNPRALSPNARERPMSRGPGIRRSSSLVDFKGL